MEGLLVLLILGGLGLAVCFFLMGTLFKERKVEMGFLMGIIGIIAATIVGNMVLNKFNNPNELKDGIYQIRVVAVSQEDVGVIALKEQSKTDPTDLPRYYKIPTNLFAGNVPKIGTTMTIEIRQVKPILYRELIIKEVHR